MVCLLGIEIDLGSRFLHGLHGSGAAYAASGTGHALQQISVILSGLGQGKHLAALPEALGIHDLYLLIRIHIMDNVYNRLCNASGNCEITSVCGCIIDILTLCETLKVYVLCLKYACHLLEGQDEIHLGTNGSSHGLQLLCGAGSYKYHLAVLMLGLDKPCAEGHGGQGHGYALSLLGEELLCHH